MEPARHRSSIGRGWIVAIVVEFALALSFVVGLSLDTARRDWERSHVPCLMLSSWDRVPDSIHESGEVARPVAFAWMSCRVFRFQASPFFPTHVERFRQLRIVPNDMVGRELTPGEIDAWRPVLSRWFRDNEQPRLAEEVLLPDSSEHHRLWFMNLANGVFVTIPILGGLAFVVFAVPPWIRTQRALMERRRFERSHRCPHCGYDLRASGARCPECGEVASTETDYGHRPHAPSRIEMSAPFTVPSPFRSALPPKPH